MGFGRAIGNERSVHLGAQANMCRTQAPTNLWHMASLLPLCLLMTPTLAAVHVSAGDVRATSLGEFQHRAIVSVRPK
jgi:hypothetical protein